MAEPLSKGQSFESMDIFQQRLRQYCAEEYVLIRVHASKTVSQYNKDLEKRRVQAKKNTTVEDVDVKWKYTHVHYTCVHHGEARVRGLGVRPHQRLDMFYCLLYA